MIKIIDNFYFTSDGGVYTLFECGKRNKVDRKTRKQTDEIVDFTDTIGYFGRLPEMLERCLSIATQRRSDASDCSELSEFISIMRTTYDEIRNSVSFSFEGVEMK